MTHPPDPDELEYRGRLQRALGDDFDLHDLIGRGGFGSVYAAWDRKLERSVAVKALRHDLFPTRLVLERFQREAKAVAKLRHPNILPVYAVGEGDGLAYMMMPVIEGQNLAALMRDAGRVDMATAIRITVEVAGALESAHRLGIVHRDVKPENILLDGPGKHALLSDFGIAKSAEDHAALTGSGVILGSPQYMSPEQAAAEKEIDGRSDIYSLGAVSYEMLAGRRPFEANSLQQLRVLQFTTDAAPLGQVAPDVPAALSDAVMRALTRDPAQRWQTIGEFAAAVTAASPKVSVAPAPDPTWFARRGLQFGALCVIGLWITMISLPLIDAANAAQNRGMQVAVQTLRSTALAAVFIGMAYLAIELVAILIRAGRSRMPREELRRRVWR